MLSDSEDEFRDDDLHHITVNAHYAKAFQYKKEREELEKLKEKLGSDVSESDIEEEETDSESAESEDEDGEELTPAVDAAILRTLARIRQKDPSIYESSKDIFEEEQGKLATRTFVVPGKNKKDYAKPVTMRQVALEAQLNPSRSPSPEPLTHIQEQAALRDETISAFHTAVNRATDIPDDDDEDELLVPREKTKDEQEYEEEQYRAFLEREVGDLKNIIIGEEGVAVKDGVDVEEEGKRKKKKTKKKGDEQLSTKRKSKEEQDQEFLMGYILSRGWIDKSKNCVPTYNEITSSKRNKRISHPYSDSEPGSAPDNDDEDNKSIHSDSSFDSLLDHFESSYNHRFEEPNSSTIPSFPRTISTLVRREDTTRKDARERRKKRKEEEMEKKREEVRRLKALKMREIRRKLEVVGKEIGNKGKGKEKGKVVHWEDGDDNEDMDEALKELDLEGDWDPDKHDKQMAGLFGGDGHEEEDGEGDWDDTGQVDEDGKPVWEDDIDIGDIHVFDNDDNDVMQIPNSKKDEKQKKKKKNKKKKKKKDEGKGEDDGVDVDIMDADLQALNKQRQFSGESDEEEEEEEWDGTEEMRKRKLDEYMDEVYNLDFNDMVGNLPTRFKYAPVAPQAYSLTPVEILLATDKELNEFMSIKRYAPYKHDARKWDTKRQQKLQELKTTLDERSRNGGWLVKGEGVKLEAGVHDSGGGEGKVKAKKRKGKKERMRVREGVSANVDLGAGAGTGTSAADVNVDEGENDGGDAEVKANSYGAYAEVEKSTKSKKKLSKLSSKSKDEEDEKGKGYKRKRNEMDGSEDAEANMDMDVEVQEPYQRKEKEKEKKDEDGKVRKKRRRKHKKSGEDVE